MPKTRRTRKQKIAANRREQIPSVSQTSQPQQPVATGFSYTFQTPTTSLPQSKPTIVTSDYTYLFKDLRHTLVVIGLIIIVELLLFYVFNH